jgi:hypothetical protein
MEKYETDNSSYFCCLWQLSQGDNHAIAAIESYCIEQPETEQKALTVMAMQTPRK